MSFTLVQSLSSSLGVGAGQGREDEGGAEEGRWSSPDTELPQAPRMVPNSEEPLIEWDECSPHVVGSSGC